MLNLTEVPAAIKQWATIIFGAVLLTGALYFTVFKSQREANMASEQKLANKLRAGFQCWCWPNESSGVALRDRLVECKGVEARRRI